MHRRGHLVLKKAGIDLVLQQRQALHRMAGHFVRSGPTATVRIAMCTRALAWWRWNQSRWTCKWSGLHPKRFNCYRWEAQLTEYYGEATLAKYDDPPEGVGWMLRATDRDAWKASEHAFAAHTE